MAGFRAGAWPSVQRSYAGGVSLDWRSGALAEGLRCYRNAEYFAAHEHWESVWLRLKEPEKSFLQALIQVTAAFHHYKKGNVVGAASLLRRALRRLEACPAEYGGLCTAPLCGEVRAWVRALEDGGAVPGSVVEIDFSER